MTIVSGCSKEVSSDQTSNQTHVQYDESKPLANSLNDPRVIKNTLNDVRCDGKEYAVDIESEDAVVLLTLPIGQQNQINDLKSSVVIQEFFEIGQNEKNLNMPMEIKYSFGGMVGSESGNLENGMVMSLVIIKADKLLQDGVNPLLKLQASMGYSLLAMNQGEEKGELSFLCKLAQDIQ